MQKNQKKHNKYRVTPEAYKRIVEICATLSPIAKTNNQKQILYRTVSKSVLGKDLTPEQARMVQGKGSNDEIKDTDRFVRRSQEPVLVNHQVELIEIYQKHGWNGVDNYIMHVRKLVDDGAERKRKDEEEAELRRLAKEPKP